MYRYTLHCVVCAVIGTAYRIFNCERLELINLAALLAYEWCITFGDEVNFFWRNKLSLVTCLFALNRYSSLLYPVIGWLNFVVFTEEVSTLCISVVG